MNTEQLLSSPSKKAFTKAKFEQKAPVNELGLYADFLETFIHQGYQFIFFQELKDQHKQLMLRHDIDFETHFALQTALIESEMGIKATYFFLLRSNFYNVFSYQDFDNIVRIRDLGHSVSLHFDPVIYEDFHSGLKQEVTIFEKYFGEKVEIISLHRPNEFFQDYNSPIMGIEHTYQNKYFRDIKYFSDSTGVWRFGHPHDSEEFLSQKSLHVLIHPIWWMVDGSSNLEKLQTYYSQRVQNLKSEFSNNCIPFRKIYATV